MKIDGLDNDLVERVKTDPYFSPIVNKLDVLLDAKTFIGRAPEQVYEFISREVEPALKNYITLPTAKPAELAVWKGPSYLFLSTRYLFSLILFNKRKIKPNICSQIDQKIDIRFF